MSSKEIFDEKMNALADSINEKSGSTGTKNLDELKSAVDSISAGGTEVIANPTLEGGEDDLTSIEIDGTKYAIPEGSSVEANPTLAGTEADLVGIEVDGVKYAVPNGAYVATNSDATHMSQDSYNYIIANWNTIPCFFVAEDRLCRVADYSSNIIASDMVFSAMVNGNNILKRITVSSTLQYQSYTMQVPRITPNPSDTATSDLTKVKIGSTTYNIPQGTEVQANPTLAGTEAELTGLEVGGTKYKVPAGAYFAELADASHITQESLDYIVANYLTVPCYISTGTEIGLVTDVSSYSIVASCGSTIGATIQFNATKTIKVTRSDRQILVFTSTIATVEANSSSVVAGNLSQLKIGASNYSIRDGATHGLGYLTTAPTSANNDGIKIVVLSAEPATKYAGYLYIITA